MLNLLSAVIMFLAGLYIQFVFGCVLTNSVLVILWMSVVLYAIMQVEFGYGVLRKHIAQVRR